MLVRFLRWVAIFGGYGVGLASVQFAQNLRHLPKKWAYFAVRTCYTGTK